MNIKEYRDAFQEIENRIKEEKRKLINGYIKIRVEKIKVFLDPVQPSCVYYGELLTVKGKSRKIKKEVSIYQKYMIKGEK